jgi:hypothetical protein
MREGRLWATSLLLLVGAVAAQADDPPARVARVAYVQGSVSFRPSNLEEWAPASINRPMTTGDHMWTDKGARGEIRLDTAVVRLGPETAFAFLNVDDRVTQMQVTQGSATIHVRTVGADQAFEVDTPNAAISLLHPGSYRIDVDPDGDSTVSVHRGDAAATAEGSEVPLHAREVGVFSGAHPPIYDIQDPSAPDDWDKWCTDREQRDDQPRASARYVSDEVVGSEDLDQYGSWQQDSQYGPVWYPSTVSASWAPYRTGHWGYVAPWGWTWIDDAPWGFAPFHYGRWCYSSGRWGWVAGTVVARPVYAPALVAFAGGSNWSVSLAIGGGGGIAWFPLGPHEVYYPSYAVSPTYVQNINVTHVNVTNINVTNVNAANVTYVNQSVAGAVTAVPRSTFVSAQPVAAAAVAVPAATAASLRGGSAPGVQPSAQSVLAQPVATTTHVPQPPAAIVSKGVVAKLTPPPAAPAFGGAASHALITRPMITPAIPLAGLALAGAGMRAKRASLPPARPATAPILSSTAQHNLATSSTSPASPSPSRPQLNDRPSRAPSHLNAESSKTTTSSSTAHSGSGQPLSHAAVSDTSHTRSTDDRKERSGATGTTNEGHSTVGQHGETGSSGHATSGQGEAKAHNHSSPHGTGGSGGEEATGHSASAGGGSTHSGQQAHQGEVAGHNHAGSHTAGSSSGNETAGHSSGAGGGGAHSGQQTQERHGGATPHPKPSPSPHP